MLGGTYENLGSQSLMRLIHPGAPTPETWDLRQNIWETNSLGIEGQSLSQTEYTDIVHVQKCHSTPYIPLQGIQGTLLLNQGELYFDILQVGFSTCLWLKFTEHTSCPATCLHTRQGGCSGASHIGLDALVLSIPTSHHVEGFSYQMCCTTSTANLGCRISAPHMFLQSDRTWHADRKSTSCPSVVPGFLVLGFPSASALRRMLSL
jgi:hypothetical protein